MSCTSPWPATTRFGSLDLARQRLAPFAGNGNENIKDGPCATSSFAQPSGLTSDGKTLYVADSEVSGIRAVGGGRVQTIVGTGLFDFGDVDGTGPQVRLQHALGVVYVDGLLYVADTYNNKLKVIDPLRRSCTTFLGGNGSFSTSRAASATATASSTSPTPTPTASGWWT